MEATSSVWKKEKDCDFGLRVDEEVVVRMVGWCCPGTFCCGGGVGVGCEPVCGEAMAVLIGRESRRGRLRTEERLPASRPRPSPSSLLPTTRRTHHHHHQHRLLHGHPRLQPLVRSPSRPLSIGLVISLPLPRSATPLLPAQHVTKLRPSPHSLLVRPSLLPSQSLTDSARHPQA